MSAEHRRHPESQPSYLAGEVPNHQAEDGGCAHQWVQVAGSHRVWRDNETWRMRCTECGRTVECEN